MEYRQTVSALPKAIPFARFIKALILGRGLYSCAAHVAESWRDSPGVHLALKSVVEAIDTGGVLARYGVSQEFVELSRGVSIVGKLRGLMRSVPFTLAVPRETTGATASWVGEAMPIPVSKL